MQGMVPPTPGPPLSSLILEMMIVGAFIAAAVYMLHRYDQPTPEEAQDKASARVRPWMITTVLLILVFFGPISLNIYPGMGFMGDYVYIFSMTWQITDIATMSLYMFDIPIVMMTFLLVFMRPVFVYQLSRYYKGKTSRGRTIAVGIISELQLTIITGLAMLVPAGAVAFMIAVPIPFLLLLSFILMWLVPIPKTDVQWKELDEPKDWWDRESETVSDVIVEGN
ncbi:MAG: hypothetical protein ACW98J_07960 [Candidatus Thorarchaeota archaeon]|jgi:hypothetical protein